MSLFKNVASMPSLGFAVRPALIAALLGLFSLASTSSALAGDIDKGAEIAKGVCASCHAETGLSTVVTNPILAGQYESYIIQSLKGYRSGVRENAIMAVYAKELSDADIENLAAYFSSQESPLRTAPRN